MCPAMPASPDFPCLTYTWYLSNWTDEPNCIFPHTIKFAFPLKSKAGIFLSKLSRWLCFFFFFLFFLLPLLLLSALQLNITYRVCHLNTNMTIVWKTPPTPHRSVVTILHGERRSRPLCMRATYSRDFWVSAWLRAVELTISMLYSDRWQSTPCSTQYHVDKAVFFSVRICCGVMVKR